jgi:hypothetical protein
VPFNSIKSAQGQCYFTPLQTNQTETVPNSNFLQEESTIVSQYRSLQRLHKHRLKEYAPKSDAPFLASLRIIKADIFASRSSGFAVAASFSASSKLTV